AHRVSIRQG
nr:juvenile hormone binding protein, JHBP=4.9kda Glu-C peptide [Manduca sexta, Peptide Partial, 9 aa] [Manduca sexta]